MKARSGTLGVIYGNRDFFPDNLLESARREVGESLGKLGIARIELDVARTKLGGVETRSDAMKCAELFKQHSDRIDGILVCLPNFGDEKGVLEAVRGSGLKVPVLIQAYPDDPKLLAPAFRRDAFCGKISVCNNLVQAGIPFTLTESHTVHPSSDEFLNDLLGFMGICRVVNGMKGLRLGAIGARPGAFNTVRYSEKILERAGISVTTADLSEILGRAKKLDSQSAEIRKTLEKIRSYAPTDSVPSESLLQMARLDRVLREWMEENAVDATAIQCWTSLQLNWGCNVCTSMSMMSENLMPSACEVDVTGVLTMYAMQEASGTPSALVDWNNNYGNNPDKCILFHCGNWAKHFQPDGRIANAPILGSTLGVENTYGAMEGRTPANALIFGRIDTDDSSGCVKAYVCEGRLTDDELNTFGNRAVAHVGGLNQLLNHVCRNGFEHHVVMNLSRTAEVLKESFETYLGWETYLHCQGNQ